MTDATSEQEVQSFIGGRQEDEEGVDLENVEEEGDAPSTQTTIRLRHRRRLDVVKDAPGTCPTISICPTTSTTTEMNHRRHRRRIGIVLVPIVFTFFMGVLWRRATLSTHDSSSLATNKMSQPQQQGAPADSTMLSTAATTTTTAKTSTTIATPSSDDKNDTRVKFFMVAKTDRSGAAIKDMLLASAHAFANNMIFGGACIDAVNWEDVREQKWEGIKDEVLNERLPLRKQLVETLGLQDELPFACPTEEEIKSGRSVYLAHFTVRRPGFTAAWMEHIKIKTTFQYADKDPNAPLQVVVHMRRGDVTPCSLAKTRYLPNVYYLQALDLFLPQYCSPGGRPCQIKMYTERDSYESHQPFIDRNYTMDYDSSISQIWTAMVNADVFLMGMSSFSFVPAFLNKNTVIAAFQYQPYVHANAHNIIPWKEVPQDIFENALRVRDELESTCENSKP
eukprot:scaffold3134_cov182-Amphora_coffeaeformis.AAC.11